VACLVVSAGRVELSPCRTPPDTHTPSAAYHTVTNVLHAGLDEGATPQQPLGVRVGHGGPADAAAVEVARSAPPTAERATPHAKDGAVAAVRERSAAATIAGSSGSAGDADAGDDVPTFTTTFTSRYSASTGAASTRAPAQRSSFAVTAARFPAPAPRTSGSSADIGGDADDGDDSVAGVADIADGASAMPAPPLNFGWKLPSFGLRTGVARAAATPSANSAVREGDTAGITCWCDAA
jgi:hypothetical protein